MKLSYRYSPHIRAGGNNFIVMGDVVLALLPLYVLSVYFYGLRPIKNMLLSAAVCVVADLLCQLLAKRSIGVMDLSPVVTGMIIPLLLPATIPYKIIVAAGLFAILVVKQPFGGLGQNIFNPAAGAIAFAAIMWSGEVFAYPAPYDRVAIAADVARAVVSPAQRLQIGGLPSYSVLDMFMGNVPGPMGATHILVLTTCLIFLVMRKNLSGRMTLSFLGSCAVFAFLFPRIGVGRLNSVLYELMSGTLYFGAIFMLGDPTTSPKRQSSKIIYAAVTGVATMLFRYIGVFEEGFFFALLFMNAFVWFIDLNVEKHHQKKRRERHEPKSEAV